MGTENSPTPAVSEVPDYAAIAKGMDAPTEAPAEQKPVEAAPAPVEKPAEQKPPEPPKTDEKPDFTEKGFEKLVLKQQELRKATEAAKPGIELANMLGAPNAQALAKALATKDPLAALAALGISYGEVARAITGAGKPPEQKPAEQKPPEPQAMKLPPEVEEMMRDYKQMKANQQRAQLDSEIKRVVGLNAAKLKLVTGLEATDSVWEVLNEMHARGGFPSTDIEENIRIAAEEAEARLTKQSARWSKVLTPAQEAAQNQVARATETPASPASDGGGKTLNNRLTAPAANPAPTTFDPEEIIQQLAKDPNLRK